MYKLIFLIFKNFLYNLSSCTVISFISSTFNYCVYLYPLNKNVYST